MHHPFEWLEWFDSNDVKKMLERRADFILNGHEHRLDVIGKGSIFGKDLLYKTKHFSFLP